VACGEHAAFDESICGLQCPEYFKQYNLTNTSTERNVATWINSKQNKFRVGKQWRSGHFIHPTLFNARIDKGDSRASSYESCAPYVLTPWSKVLPEKLIGSQLVQQFPASFTTAFTSACHLSLFLASSIQSTPYHPTSLRTILILPFHLCICKVGQS
jgi:hypothetical protein